MEFFHRIVSDTSLAPSRAYFVLKQQFKNEVVHLFESTDPKHGDVSMVCIGQVEQVTTLHGQTYHQVDHNDPKLISGHALDFLKTYYQAIDPKPFKDFCAEFGLKFVDGFMGYLSYDMMKYFEPKLKAHMDDLKDPIGIEDCNFVRPKIVVSFLHKQSKIIATTTHAQYESALTNITKLLQCITNQTFIPQVCTFGEAKYGFDEATFMDMVRDAKTFIRKGDVFQLLLSNRLSVQARVDRDSFYHVLQDLNPSPYMFYLNYNDFALIGSSPETLVSLRDGVVTLNPIAGTRKRGTTPDRDLALEQELKSDPKERSEHIMLVDLGRNDLGRVCVPGSIQPKALMQVERYSHVMHLVSTLQGQLQSDCCDMFDVLQACFTAGTMTGTPKIRAMELIAQFEGLKRTFYSGAVGYFGFDGNMDNAIAIRTALLTQDEVILQAGAGVVADSDPKLEALEVQNKLNALKKTLELLGNHKI